ncbi:hypothetical protein HPB50_008486 [Hyalomma asiaticum]|uniref:Uncharacterized protein n=1 Tax=Hyalomma asiaticum TaxID=266040 RepID=A0ACB7RW38_HYAAI|nr:hypothetical protein HPB50_008486 [Hyalomma asiaticum]
MDVCTRHGGIIFDELKLSEQFGVNQAGFVEGFVDLGSFTADEQRSTPADHGMVMLFQPFQGDWTQILGVFSSKGNIKADMLSKLLLEAIFLAEKAGLFVDFVSCDGATWNRSMWKSFGIGERCTKFNPDILTKKDGNGDFISLWCRPSGNDSDGFCVLCNVTVSCTHHGSSAVMRHATSAKHVENARKHRDKDGVLTKSRCTQSTLDFSRNAPTTSLQESVAKAEALFALTVVANSLPYTLADVATATYPHMFPDSQIAKAFQCGRKKVSYIISDGLGPYFKGKVVEELAEPGVFYTVMIDETPVPEMKVQQLDVLVRYFSVKAQDVVVEHLQSFHMGHATADELFSCVSDSLSELPKNNMVCFFSDGPNVMKCLKRKIKAELSPNMIDIGECGLHKVHNAFAAALDTFCQEVDSIVTDIHQYFKCATRHADIKDLQQKLGLPQLEFLRHVSSRWLTLLPSIQRVLELYDALKAFFSKSGEPKTSYVRHNRLAAAFADHTLRARLLFLKNAAQLFDRFQTLFQSKKPLIHVFYEEMVAIVKLVMGRFLRQEAFKDATGFQLRHECRITGQLEGKA